MPKVSIIMPMLNSIKFLEECMDSVVNQTLKDIEIIPVDAGSTDGTVEMLEEYAKKDARIKIIHSDKKSMGYQYNLGIAESTGEYIGFVESDDYVVTDMFEKLLYHATLHDLDWVRGNYYYFMEYPKLGKQMIPITERIPVRVNTVFSPNKYPQLHLLGGGTIWSGLYKKEFFKKNNILLNETKGASFQDVGFCRQTYIYAERAMYINDCLYCYRRDNPGSSVHMQKTILFAIDEAEFILKKAADVLEKDSATKDALYARIWLQFQLYYKRLPKWDECSEEIKEAVLRYREYLVSEMEKKDFWARYPLFAQSRELMLLKEGIEIFDENFKEQRRTQVAALRSSMERVLACKKVVIFGCGDNGFGICSLLLRMEKNEVLGFADNDSNKWNKKFMGCQCYSPVSMPRGKDIVYIIANHAHYWAIRSQLQEMGITGEQILLAPPIYSYAGTSVLPEGDILPLYC